MKKKQIKNMVSRIAYVVAAGLTCAYPVASHAQSALYPDIYDLKEVRLLPGRFLDAQNLNISVLLQYDTDRLLAPYLKEAGLTPKGESFPCWDGLDGHVGGHYLSALAIHYAASGDERLKARLDYALDELGKCQKANGDGYVGGVPDGKKLFSRIKAGDTAAVWDYWVPWYNLHKTYAGLRDAWLYAGDERAKAMFLDFCDWGAGIIADLTDKQMEAMLESEFGGMNEVFADAYQMTGEKKYLDAAKKFSHRWLLDSMAKGVDNLDNKHANTQVPKVVGYERVALLDPDDRRYADAANFFWQTVTSNRSLSFGGNSRREHFAPKDDYRSYMDEREGPETCNTNNMLKLTENLFRANPDSRFADFYERAMYNHILSSQHPEHGGYVYFTSARPAHYRVYSAPNAAMWCCVGTGMENHGKYGEFVYTHSEDTVRVNLFVPSELHSSASGLTLTQTTAFPAEEATTIKVLPGKTKQFPLLIRRPHWCEDFRVKVNGREISPTFEKGYAVIDRKWEKGDEVSVSLPMTFRLEEAPEVSDYVSIMRGPIVMGARVATDDVTGYVADDSRWAHIAHGKLISVFDTPIMLGERDNIVKRLNAIKSTSDGIMTYDVDGIFSNPGTKVRLEPFSDIHDTRYMIYWLAMTPDKYAAWQETAKAEEAERLILDARTVDAINLGEQQPEADHYLTTKNSRTGNFNGEAWRTADSGGHLTMNVNTQGEKDLALRVRYYGNETGNKTFDILINDILLTTENTSGKWGADRFEDVEYPLPAELLDSESPLKVTFRPQKGSSTGGIYQLRIVKNKTNP